MIVDAYTSFAQVYDLFMDNVPYEDWSRYIINKLRKNKIDSGYVVDLGCGTGKMATMLADAGYDMIGIDNSMDMLQIAYEREDDRILYLMQDMCGFDAGEKIRAAISACDSLNYILEEQDLLSVFKSVYRQLEDGGIFIFDINTPYKYEELLAENTFAENRDESSFIWENYYDREEKINEYDLTLFIMDDSMDGLFRKFEETHFQRCYEPDLIEKLLRQAGFSMIEAFDAYTDEPVDSASEKITFMGKK